MALSLLQNSSVVPVLTFHYALKKRMPIHTHKPHHQALVWNNTTTGYIWIWKQFASSAWDLPPSKDTKSLWLSVLWADQITEKEICTFTAATILSWSLIYNFVIFISVSQLLYVFKEMRKQNTRLQMYLNYLLVKDYFWKPKSWFSKLFPTLSQNWVLNNANLAEYSQWHVVSLQDNLSR